MPHEAGLLLHCLSVSFLFFFRSFFFWLQSGPQLPGHYSPVATCSPACLTFALWVILSQAFGINPLRVCSVALHSPYCCFLCCRDTHVQMYLHIHIRDSHLWLVYGNRRPTLSLHAICTTATLCPCLFIYLFIFGFQMAGKDYESMTPVVLPVCGLMLWVIESDWFAVYHSPPA